MAFKVTLEPEELVEEAGELSPAAKALSKFTPRPGVAL